MLVKELIEMLQDCPQDMEIYKSVSSGDYWRTQLALNIEQPGEVEVKHTNYHNCLKIVEENYSDDPEEDQRFVLVI